MALPGVTTTIKDRFYTLSRTDIPVGPRILAIAKRTTDPTEDTDLAPDLDPYPATREDNVIAQFGEGSDLHRAYLELASGGAQRIILLPLPVDTVFSHGDATLSSADYETANEGADLFDDLFAAAEAAQPDIIIPWGRGAHPNDWEDPATPGNDADLGFYANNSSVAANSWANRIADKMHDITVNGTPVFAVLGLKPSITTTESLTPKQVSDYLDVENLVSRSSVTYGHHLIVVAGEIKPVGYPEEYGYSNGAAFFAAHTAQLDSWTSPTGKSIFNVQRIRYNPTRVQQQALVDLGICPVGVDYNRNPIWVDALTFSAASSDYTRLTTLRVVFDAVQLVRQVAQRFVGEAASLQAKNSLETAVTSGLRSMQTLGALITSNFEITYIPAENRAIIDLVLTPAFELRNIEVRVSVNF